MNIAEELIIENPRLQSVGQKVKFSIITLIFWAFWIYLLIPLVSLVAWLLGFKFFYDQMVVLGGWVSFKEKFLFYITAVGIFAFVFFGWAFYNRLRFKRKSRRGRFWKPAIISLSSEFNIPESMVLDSQNSRRLEVHFKDDGTIKEIKNTILLND